MYTLPDVGFSSPASWFSSVDLPPARLADDTAELALFYRQIDIIQRNDALLADGMSRAAFSVRMIGAKRTPPYVQYTTYWHHI